MKKGKIRYDIKLGRRNANWRCDICGVSGMSIHQKRYICEPCHSDHCFTCTDFLKEGKERMLKGCPCGGNLFLKPKKSRLIDDFRCVQCEADRRFTYGNWKYCCSACTDEWCIICMADKSEKQGRLLPILEDLLEEM